MKKGFTLMELLLVIALLGLLIIAGLGSFVSSLQKGRDTKRKNDLRQIAVALETYYNDFGHYPLSDSNGDIMGCGAAGVLSCTWGSDWNNTVTGTIYMTALPTDPTPSQTYFYVSDFKGTYFQLYARLENTHDSGTGINQSPGFVGTVCIGTKTVCTYGIASPNATP